MLVALLVLQSLTGSGPFSTKTATITVTTSDAYEAVAGAYASHLAQLNSRDIPALAKGYQSNATVEWVGVVPGMTGNYSGRPTSTFYGAASSASSSISRCLTNTSP